jgi:hypothetical protein
MARPNGWQLLISPDRVFDASLVGKPNKWVLGPTCTVTALIRTIRFRSGICRIKQTRLKT